MNSFISSCLLLCIAISHCMAPLSMAQRAASSPVFGSGTWHSFLPGWWKGWKRVIILLFFPPYKQKHLTVRKFPSEAEEMFMWTQQVSESQDKSSWGQGWFCVPNRDGAKALLMQNSKNVTQTTDIILTPTVWQRQTLIWPQASLLHLPGPQELPLFADPLFDFFFLDISPALLSVTPPSPAKAGTVKVRVIVWTRVKSESFLPM